MSILDQETISWKSVADELPDDETVVLVHAPGADEPVWLGFYDGVYWFSVDGPTYGDPDEISAEVTAWATMPKGAGIAEEDPTPWCGHCGAKRKADCRCGPLAENE